MPKTTIPTIAEIGEHETLIRVTGGPVDDLGRTQFCAFWHATDGILFGKVRGQVFFSNVEQFIARQAQDGRTVRTI